MTTSILFEKSSQKYRIKNEYILHIMTGKVTEWLYILSFDRKSSSFKISAMIPYYYGFIPLNKAYEFHSIPVDIDFKTLKISMVCLEERNQRLIVTIDDTLYSLSFQYFDNQLNRPTTMKYAMKILFDTIENSREESADTSSKSGLKDILDNLRIEFILNKEIPIPKQSLMTVDYENDCIIISNGRFSREISFDGVIMSAISNKDFDMSRHRHLFRINNRTHRSENNTDDISDYSIVKSLHEKITSENQSEIKHKLPNNNLIVVNEENIRLDDEYEECELSDDDQLVGIDLMKGKENGIEVNNIKILDFLYTNTSTGGCRIYRYSDGSISIAYSVLQMNDSNNAQPNTSYKWYHSYHIHCSHLVSYMKVPNSKKNNLSLLAKVKYPFQYEYYNSNNNHPNNTIFTKFSTNTDENNDEDQENDLYCSPLVSMREVDHHLNTNEKLRERIRRSISVMNAFNYTEISQILKVTLVPTEHTVTDYIELLLLSATRHINDPYQIVQSNLSDDVFTLSLQIVRVFSSAVYTKLYNNHQSTSMHTRLDVVYQQPHDEVNYPTVNETNDVKKINHNELPQPEMKPTSDHRNYLALECMKSNNILCDLFNKKSVHAMVDLSIHRQQMQTFIFIAITGYKLVILEYPKIEDQLMSIDLSTILYTSISISSMANASNSMSNNASQYYFQENNECLDLQEQLRVITLRNRVYLVTSHLNPLIEIEDTRESSYLTVQKSSQQGKKSKRNTREYSRMIIFQYYLHTSVHNQYSHSPFGGSTTDYFYSEKDSKVLRVIPFNSTMNTSTSSDHQDDDNYNYNESQSKTKKTVNETGNHEIQETTFHNSTVITNSLCYQQYLTLEQQILPKKLLQEFIYLKHSSNKQPRALYPIEKSSSVEIEIIPSHQDPPRTSTTYPRNMTNKIIINQSDRNQFVEVNKANNYLLAYIKAFQPTYSPAVALASTAEISLFHTRTKKWKVISLVLPEELHWKKLYTSISVMATDQRRSQPSITVVDIPQDRERIVKVIRYPWNYRSSTLEYLTRCSDYYAERYTGSTQRSLDDHLDEESITNEIEDDGQNSTTTTTNNQPMRNHSYDIYESGSNQPSTLRRDSFMSTISSLTNTTIQSNTITGAYHLHHNSHYHMTGVPGSQHNYPMENFIYAHDYSPKNIQKPLPHFQAPIKDRSTTTTNNNRTANTTASASGHGHNHGHSQWNLIQARWLEDANSIALLTYRRPTTAYSTHNNPTATNSHHRTGEYFLEIVSKECTQRSKEKYSNTQKYQHSRRHYLLPLRPFLQSEIDTRSASMVFDYMDVLPITPSPEEDSLQHSYCVVVIGCQQFHFYLAFQITTKYQLNGQKANDVVAAASTANSTRGNIFYSEEHVIHSRKKVILDYQITHLWTVDGSDSQFYEYLPLDCHHTAGDINFNRGSTSTSSSRIQLSNIFFSPSKHQLSVDSGVSNVKQILLYHQSVPLHHNQLLNYFTLNPNYTNHPYQDKLRNLSSDNQKPPLHQNDKRATSSSLPQKIHHLSLLVLTTNNEVILVDVINQLCIHLQQGSHPGKELYRKDTSSFITVHEERDAIAQILGRIHQLTVIPIELLPFHTVTANDHSKSRLYGSDLIYLHRSKLSPYLNNYNQYQIDGTSGTHSSMLQPGNRIRYTSLQRVLLGEKKLVFFLQMILQRLSKFNLWREFAVPRYHQRYQRYLSSVLFTETNTENNSLTNTNTRRNRYFEDQLLVFYYLPAMNHHHHHHFSEIQHSHHKDQHSMNNSNDINTSHQHQCDHLHPLRESNAHEFHSDSFHHLTFYFGEETLSDYQNHYQLYSSYNNNTNKTLQLISDLTQSNNNNYNSASSKRNAMNFNEIDEHRNSPLIKNVASLSTVLALIIIDHFGKKLHDCQINNSTNSSNKNSNQSSELNAYFLRSSISSHHNCSNANSIHSSHQQRLLQIDINNNFINTNNNHKNIENSYYFQSQEFHVLYGMFESIIKAANGNNNNTDVVTTTNNRSPKKRRYQILNQLYQREKLINILESYLLVLTEELPHFHLLHSQYLLFSALLQTTSTNEYHNDPIDTITGNELFTEIITKVARKSEPHIVRALFPFFVKDLSIFVNRLPTALSNNSGGSANSLLETLNKEDFSSLMTLFQQMIASYSQTNYHLHTTNSSEVTLAVNATDDLSFQDHISHSSMHSSNNNNSPQRQILRISESPSVALLRASRILLITCDWLGGTESHLSTVCALLMVLEFQYRLLSSAFIHPFIQTVPFTLRLFDMLSAHGSLLAHTDDLSPVQYPRSESSSASSMVLSDQRESIESILAEYAISMKKRAIRRIDLAKIPELPMISAIEPPMIDHLTNRSMSTYTQSNDTNKSNNHTSASSIWNLDLWARNLWTSITQYPNKTTADDMTNSKNPTNSNNNVNSETTTTQILNSDNGSDDDDHVSITSSSSSPVAYSHPRAHHHQQQQQQQQQQHFPFLATEILESKLGVQKFGELLLCQSHESGQDNHRRPIYAFSELFGTLVRDWLEKLLEQGQQYHPHYATVILAVTPMLTDRETLRALQRYIRERLDQHLKRQRDTWMTSTASIAVVSTAAYEQKIVALWLLLRVNRMVRRCQQHYQYQQQQQQQQQQLSNDYNLENSSSNDSGVEKAFSLTSSISIQYLLRISLLEITHATNANINANAAINIDNRTHNNSNNNNSQWSMYSKHLSSSVDPTTNHHQHSMHSINSINEPAMTILAYSHLHRVPLYIRSMKNSREFTVNLTPLNSLLVNMNTKSIEDHLQDASSDMVLTLGQMIYVVGFAYLILGEFEMVIHLLGVLSMCRALPNDYRQQKLKALITNFQQSCHQMTDRNNIVERRLSLMREVIEEYFFGILM